MIYLYYKFNLYDVEISKLNMSLDRFVNNVVSLADKLQDQFVGLLSDYYVDDIKFEYITDVDVPFTTCQHGKFKNNLIYSNVVKSLNGYLIYVYVPLITDNVLNRLIDNSSDDIYKMMCKEPQIFDYVKKNDKYLNSYYIILKNGEYKQLSNIDMITEYYIKSEYVVSLIDG